MAQPTLPRSLSEREARLLSQLSATGQRIFTIQDAHAILDEEEGGARKLLHRLCAKRWVERLERGKYLIIPLEAGPEGDWAAHEYLVAASLVAPYYLAYGTALNYYGYTERLPRPIWVATTKRKRSLTIEGVEYRFVALVERKFFGHTAIERNGEHI